MTSECLEFTGARNASNGYGRKWDPIARQVRGAHVIAWERHHGRPVPAGMVVRHRCDNRPCVNPDHLELGTHSDNSRDMIDRGRGRGQFATGHNVTLSDEDVAAIRSEWTGRYGQAAELARRFGVHRTTVLRIAKREART